MKTSLSIVLLVVVQALFLNIAPLAQGVVVDDLTRSFTDLDPQDYYFWPTETLHDMGVVTGDDPAVEGGQTSFRPLAPINRAEVMALLMRALEYQSGIDLNLETYQNCFPDVQDEWFAGPICYAEQEGWVEGYPDGYFHPDYDVNNAEFLKMLANTQGLNEAVEDLENQWISLDFTDYLWYEPYFQLSYQMNLLRGDVEFGEASEREMVSDSTFRLMAVLETIAAEDSAEPSMTPYTAEMGNNLVEETLGEIVTDSDHYAAYYEIFSSDTGETDDTQVQSYDSNSPDFDKELTYCGYMRQHSLWNYQEANEHGSTETYRSFMRVFPRIKFTLQNGVIDVVQLVGTANYLNRTTLSYTANGETTTYTATGDAGFNGRENGDTYGDGYYEDKQIEESSISFLNPGEFLLTETLFISTPDDPDGRVEEPSGDTSIDWDLHELAMNGYSEDGSSRITSGQFLGTGSYKETSIFGEVLTVNWSFSACEE